MKYKCRMPEGPHKATFQKEEKTFANFGLGKLQNIFSYRIQTYWQNWDKSIPHPLKECAEQFLSLKCTFPDQRDVLTYTHHELHYTQCPYLNYSRHSKYHAKKGKKGIRGEEGRTRGGKKRIKGENKKQIQKDKYAFQVERNPKWFKIYFKRLIETRVNFQLKHHLYTYMCRQCLHVFILIILNGQEFAVITFIQHRLLNYWNPISFVRHISDIGKKD